MLRNDNNFLSQTVKTSERFEFRLNTSRVVPKDVQAVSFKSKNLLYNDSENERISVVYEYKT